MLNGPKRTDFWSETARRAQAESVRAAWTEEQPPQERKPLRRDPPPPPPPLLATDDPLKLRLSDELEYARRLLEGMGDELASDPAIVMRHTAALQHVDIVGQMLGHVAAVIRAQMPDEAVERIGMHELKARLKRRSSL